MARWQERANGCGADTAIVGVPRLGEGAVDVAARALASVAGPCRVLGVSGGAASALAIAATAPARVDRLAIVSGVPHPVHGLGPLQVLADADPETFRELCALVFADQLAQLDAVVEEMAGDLAHLREPWAFDLGAIACPTTIFHAVDDQSCSVDGARWLAGQIAGSTYVEWTDGGHGAGTAHLGEIFAALTGEN